MLDFDYVRQYFEERITKELTGIPIQYENVVDSPEIAAAKDKATNWGRITVRDGEGFSITCGPAILRRFLGSGIFSIFCRPNEGTAELRRIATVVANFMARQEREALLIRTPYLVMVGKSEAWVQGNVMMPYELDQIQ